MASPDTARSGTEIDAEIESEIESWGSACLDHLASEPELLARFMNLTGMDTGDVRARAGTCEFSMGLIDFFASDEAALMALCANAGRRPEAFMRVYHRLNPDG